MDQCYTLTQRDFKYTLMHTKKRITRSTVVSFLKTLDQLYSIKGTCIFGYQVVSMGKEIDEHPGMQLIVEGLNNRSPALDCWIEDGDIRNYKRGLLYKHILDLPAESMPKTVLIKRFKGLDGKLKEYVDRVQQMESEIEQLRQENRRLKNRIETQEFVFIRAGRSNLLLPSTP